MNTLIVLVVYVAACIALGCLLGQGLYLLAVRRSRRQREGLR